MTDPCQQVGRIAVLEQQLIGIKDSCERIELVVNMMVAQMTKLAVLEERHDNQETSVTRAFKRIEAIEHKQVAHDKFIWMSAGAAMALSIVWTVFGGWLMGQVADTRTAVAEMRMHITTDKITSPEDIPRPAK